MDVAQNVQLELEVDSIEPTSADVVVHATSAGQGDQAEVTGFKVVGDSSAKNEAQEESDDDDESGSDDEAGEDEDDEADGDVAKRVEYYLEKYQQVFKCKICSRVVGGKKWHAKRHVRAHWNIRPYACIKCDAKFLRNDHLKRHVEKQRCQGLKEAASAGHPVDHSVLVTRVSGITSPTVTNQKAESKPPKVKKRTQRGQPRKQIKATKRPRTK